MKEILSNPIYLTILLLIIFYGIIIYIRPQFLFMNKSKKPKIFGTGSKNNKTIFPIWFILLVFCVITYPIVQVIITKLS